MTSYSIWALFLNYSHKSPRLDRRHITNCKSNNRSCLLFAHINGKKALSKELMNLERKYAKSADVICKVTITFLFVLNYLEDTVKLWCSLPGDRIAPNCHLLLEKFR